MKIEHVAIWTRDLEGMKKFYTDYFGGKAGEKYTNASKSFESYFISFDSGARLELMRMPSIPENLNDRVNQHIGIAHIAISVGSIEKVDSITDELIKTGYTLLSKPRHTGDGYYESCILDPEGNRLEITV